MRNFLLMAICLLTSSLAHAQLRPPVQTDTLKVMSVKYNFMDIKPENWPCDVIYKSTTDFRIGDQSFMIESAREDHSYKYHANGVIFKMIDGSELSYYETTVNRIVIYSGYEFFCDSATTPESLTTATVKNADLQGRNVIGTLPRPSYSVQESGTVVVTIWVDQYGNVTKAQAGAEGTTATSKKLWEEARKAALRAHFNQKADAPALQQGTITYIFSLK